MRCVGDHRRHRLAEVPHLAVGERRLIAEVKAELDGKIGARHHRPHARRAGRLCGINGRDDGVRVRADEQGGMEQSGRMEIVGEPGPPVDLVQPVLARQGRSDDLLLAH